jgi:hypothetical protein
MKQAAVMTALVAFVLLGVVVWQYRQAHPRYNLSTYCDDILAGNQVQAPPNLAIDCAVPPDPRV